jgi:tetratricopeptide (TPR) repeat protein
MFLQVLDIDAEDAMANNGMGEIHFERNEFEDSIKYFKAAILAEKKYSVAYLGQAKSLYQLEKFAECRDILEAGIAIASKNGDLMPANQMQVILLKI